MNFIGVLFVLIPGLISAVYYCTLKKIKMASIDFFVSWLVFSFLINLICITLLFLTGFEELAMNQLFTSVSKITKYGIAAFSTSLLLPNIVYLFRIIKIGKKNEK